MIKFFKTIFVMLLTVFSVQAQYQNKISLPLQRKISTARLANQPVSLLIKGEPTAVRAAVIAAGGKIKFFAGDIASVIVPAGGISQLANESAIQRIEGNDQALQPLNDQLVINNHIQEVHLGFNLPKDYQGENVVMGIIDEGIDYTHPDFRDANGNTRIKYLWDQSLLNADSATQPQPYGYGKEYIGQQIDTSTQHFDSRFSHGSHVAGIACGSGLALNNYKGVAPKADIVIVKMNLNQPDNEFLSNFVDAVKYVYDRAAALGKPAVVNASLGTYFGSHDGKDIQAQAIDYLITEQNGRALVAAAGNAGSVPIHLGYNVSSDTSITWLQNTSGGIYLQVWGDSGTFENIQFSIAAERVKPDFNTLARLPFRNVNFQPGVIRFDTLYRGNDRIGIVQSGAQFWNGSWSMEYFIQPDSTTNIAGSDTSQYFWRFETTGSGKLDSWSFNFVFDNLPDSLTYPNIIHYRRPDLEQNIVSSFTCSDKVITVGSYVNRNFYTNANFAITRENALTPGALSGFSSHGPTRDGRIKPDISATGEWVLSCGTQSELNILAALSPEAVAAGRKHKRSSGTSMSAPVVAGIAALYFERYPQASWNDLKQALLNCTDRDQFTGNNLPDNSWGYGKVNGYKVVKGCTVGIDEVELFDHIHFSINPNPSGENTFIQFDLSSVPQLKASQIIVTDITGRIVRALPLQRSIGSEQLFTGDLSTGVYQVSLVAGDRNIRTMKLMVAR